MLHRTRHQELKGTVHNFQWRKRKKLSIVKNLCQFFSKRNVSSEKEEIFETATNLWFKDCLHAAVNIGFKYMSFCQFFVPVCCQPYPGQGALLVENEACIEHSADLAVLINLKQNHHNNVNINNICKQ